MPTTPQHAALNSLKLPFTVDEVELTGKAKTLPGQPPLTTEGYRTKPGYPTKMYQWANGDVASLTSISDDFYPCRSVTVVHVRQNFKSYAAPIDVRTKNVASLDTEGWPQIDGFDYDLFKQALVRLKIGVAQRENLPSNCAASWNQIFDRFYQPRNDPSCRVESVKGLVGSLAAILALAALSCPPQNQTTVLSASMNRCSSGRYWKRHEYNGFDTTRIVVVKVYYPRSMPKDRMDTIINRLESGDFGPILDAR